MATTPCADCGTIGGRLSPTGTPRRIHGLCDKCYAPRLARGEFGTNARCLSCQEVRHMDSRGLCKQCYSRALTQGAHTAYPDCGAVPVPYIERELPIHPDAPPPPMTRAAFNRYQSHDDEGRPLYRDHILGHHFDPLPIRAADEAFAERWLRAHPDQHAAWTDPSLAAFAPVREAA